MAVCEAGVGTRVAIRDYANGGTHLAVQWRDEGNRRLGRYDSVKISLRSPADQAILTAFNSTAEVLEETRSRV
jgi:hypothetical protein